MMMMMMIFLAPPNKREQLIPSAFFFVLQCAPLPRAVPAHLLPRLLFVQNVHVPASSPKKRTPERAPPEGDTFYSEKIACVYVLV